MRSDAREAAFQIVFASLFGGDSGENFRKKLYKKFQLSEEESAFAETLVTLAEEHAEELNGKLEEKVTRFAGYRIFPVDRAVMLVALTEIFYLEDVPPVVSVSEAAALARKYSAETSASFVNGVLGGFINQ